MSRSASHYRIVPHRPGHGRLWMLLVVLAWGLSLLATWWLASRQAAPGLAAAQARARAGEQALKRERERVAGLQQRQATLERSDQISRAANVEIQNSLAERDEEIAGLRADVAFYERLVGSTSQRKGLSVHTVEFSPEAGGSWHYRAVLTQTLNRGAISKGQMSFEVEGVRAGKLVHIGWDALHQKQGVPAQAYSFRYFQQLEGSVILPAGFVPQRVKLSLRGGDPVDQSFPWTRADQSRTDDNGGT